MRWAQLTLVENDPGQYDPDFWLDYFKRTHSDALCLSAGGVVAYYPTQIKYHHRSRWMGDTDPFGYLLEGCRKMDMVVIARTDPHAIWSDAYEAHPEWEAVDERGNKKAHSSMPELHLTCAHSSYNFEFMTSVHREIMSNYMIDGIFTNRWKGDGICYCESCKKRFFDYSGMQIPGSSNSLNPAYKKWNEWSLNRFYELWKLWDGDIRKINPRSRLIPNGFPIKKVVKEEMDIVFADHQGRYGALTLPWEAGKKAKELRASMGNKPIGGIFSVGYDGPWRWKDSVKSEAEIRIWVVDAIAQGMRPWFTKFSGVLHDKRWLSYVEKIYKWHFGAEKYLRNLKPLANVGLVFSNRFNRVNVGEKHQENHREHEMGMYHALVEARIPFEMVQDEYMTIESLKNFKMLILPSIAVLSDEQCRLIEEYVNNGGSLLSTFETSLYDENGVKRNDFGLKNIFGVSYNGRIEGRMKNSYLRLSDEGGVPHPILEGLEDAARIINGLYRLDVKPNEEFPSPVTLIPAYPDLPMEQVYPRIPVTDTREVYLRQLGKSRVTFIPWDIDRTFWQILDVDHGILLRNALHWTLSKQQPVIIEGKGIVDISVWLQENSMTVHLVNLTNPMMLKGSYREFIALPKQKVKIQIPEDRKPAQVKFLVAGVTPEYSLTGNEIELFVSDILDHEVIAVDFV